MITASEISTVFGYPVVLQIMGGAASIDDAENPSYVADPVWSEPEEGETPELISEAQLVVPEESRVRPWHQAYAQACWDAGAILPYDEVKAEQLYNWVQAGVPVQVHKSSFFLALYRLRGKTLQDTKDAIDTLISNPNQNYEAHTQLETCQQIHRDNPLIDLIGENVWGLDAEDIDAVFIMAGTI